MRIVSNPDRSVELTAPVRISRYPHVGLGAIPDAIAVEDRDLAQILRENLAELPEEADGTEDLWRRKVRITVEVLG